MVHGEFDGDCKPVKTRLDKLLVDRGMTPSRERAQALILAGKVLVNEQKIEKAGASVESGCAVRLLGEDIRYVSRGGLKLEKALDHWLAQPDSGPQQLHEDIYVKLLLATRIANGELKGMLARQKRAYLQRLRDLNRLEEGARRDGRIDLARLVRGALLHTEADLKWMDELSSERFGTEGTKTE